MLVKAGANWVSGERFFDREAELEALRERVQEGTHTLLTAQRRMGKTSLIRELLRRISEEGEYDTVFVDLERAEDAPDALAEIGARTRSSESLWTRMAARVLRLRDIGDRVEEVGIAGLRARLRAGIDAGNWRREGERIFEALAGRDRPVVLAIDELPLLVNRLLTGPGRGTAPEGKRDADLFLSFLRKSAQDFKGDIRMIVSGSIGLEPVLRRAGLSAHANVFSRYELKPWTEDIASACLAELAETYEIDIPEPVRREMCRRLRCCIPHHVQEFFSKLRDDLCQRKRREADTDDVERVYRDDMLGSAGQIDLDHYEQRLKVVLGPTGYRIALELLTAATAGEGLSDADVEHCRAHFGRAPEESSPVDIPNVMDVLRHDGYLAPAPGGGYRFVSGWLEDWWRARHGGGFVPVWNR